MAGPSITEGDGFELRSVATSRRPRLWLALLSLGLLSAVAAPARAQPTAAQIFEQARQAYVRGDYAEVVEALEPLVGGPVPSISDRILVRESRKYLGASYILTDQRQSGIEQFEALLRAEGDVADYRLDPAAFPSAVHDVFDGIRDRLLDEQRREEDERGRERARRERRRRDALVALVGLAQDQEVEIEHSPALAWVPFGAGQFQNGDEGLGWFFAVSQAATALIGVASLIAYFPVLDAAQQSATVEGSIDPTLETALGVLSGLNWGGAGAFAVLAAIGIIEAHVSFVPSHTERRTRPVPDGILRDLELAVGPGGASATLRFW